MTYFKVALLALSSLGYVKYIAEQLKLGFSAAPFVYCAFVSVCLYFFAILDALVLGTWLATILGLGLLIYGLITSRKQYFSFAQPPVFAVLMVLVVFWLYLAIDENFKFLLWDEFSFWAASTRLIYTTDLLFKENSPIFFKSYPPIQQLFQYYVMQFFSWSEKNTLFAQNILLMSGVLCISGLPNATTFVKTCLFVSVATLVYAFGYSFSSLYSDALLGICFAVALSFAMREDQSPTVWMALVISLTVLMLLKEIGILLVLVVVFVYAANLLLSTPVKKSQIQNNTFTHLYIGLRAHWLRLSLIFVIIIFVMQSWAWYVKSIGASRVLTIPSLNAWRDESHQRRLLATLGEFVNRMFETGYVSIAAPFKQGHPTILMIVVTLSLLSGLAIYLAKPKQRVFYGVVMGTLFVGFWGYAAALVLSYLIVFTEYEGVRLASFERYLSTYLLAWGGFVLIALFIKISGTSRKTAAVMGAMCVVVLTLMTNSQLFKELRGIKSAGPDHLLRSEIEGFADQVKKSIEPERKIYFIAQNSNGLERVMFYYAMLPHTVSTSWCWSLGDKYFEGDVWTCNETLGGVLRGYDYLALYRGDDQFWNKNKSFFDSASVGGVRGLYKINHLNGNTSLTQVVDK